MRTIPAIITALAIVASIPHSSLADDSQTPTLVVTATRNPTPISTIGSSVSVLTAADLDALGVTYLDDALSTLPGVSVTQNGGPGGLSSVRLRGEESYRTLTLLDGIRIDDPSGTQIATNFANLTVGDIARVEVVRGPQSLLYGADAIGGVVQIFTQRPGPGLHYTADVSGGTYHTDSQSGTLLYGAPKFGIVLSAEHQETQGFTAKVGDPALDDPDGQRVWAFHGVARAEPSDAISLEAVVHYTYSNDKFDGESAFPPFSPADPYRNLKTKELDGRFAVTDKAMDGRLSSELAFNGSSIRRNDLSNGAPYAFGSRFDGDRRQVSLVSTFSATPTQTLVAGAENEWLSAQTDSFNEDSRRTGAFAEWEGAFLSQIYLTGGARYDDDDDFGAHWSGRATAAWLPDLFAGETTKLHASYGTGYRAPSPYERAYNAQAGLPALKEETAEGFDLGVTQSAFAHALSLDVTLFDQIVRNEIEFDNVNFTGYFQSSGHSYARGVEVTIDAKHKIKWGWLSSAELKSALTYTDSRVHTPDPENGLPRIRRPRYLSATTLSFGFGADKADLSFTLQSAAKTEDGFSYFRVPLDSYAVLDISAQYNFTPRIQFYLRGVNVSDEQYEVVSGYATSDAALYAGFRFRG